ncbi:MAG TPA: DUF6703 family protein [Micromonosporaceae bacterium]|nr:DUF6703 family protein [Micromonosporaceae bacterium]
MAGRTRGARPGLFLGALVVALVALFLPGWYGAVPLVAIVIGLAWLMSRTWPVVPPATRALRLLVLAVFAAFAVYKAIH